MACARSHSSGSLNPRLPDVLTPRALRYPEGIRCQRSAESKYSEVPCPFDEYVRNLLDGSE